MFPKASRSRKLAEEARVLGRQGGQSAEQNEENSASPDMTVDAWFEFWIENIVGDLALNTRRNYRERYVNNVQPVIGKMLLRDVRPMHCTKILIGMDADYAGSTIRQTCIAMGTMFRSAEMNGMIPKHPMDGVRYAKRVRVPGDIKYLTVEEQETFLEAVKGSHNYYQYALILETDLCTGEMIGLTWDCIGWEKRTRTVNKTLEFRHKRTERRAGPPKTVTSYRTIPLTIRAYNILLAVHASKEFRKQSPLLNQTLAYVDRRAGQNSALVMTNLVFFNFQTGEPSKNSSYDTHLYKICDESGMQPKVLQKLLGHASIQTTMDKYVHVTDSSLTAGVRQFEASRM